LTKGTALRPCDIGGSTTLNPRATAAVQVKKGKNLHATQTAPDISSVPLPATRDTFAAAARFGLLCFLAAAALRLGHLNAPPNYDELYHILAAKSWLKDGSLAIYQGSYERAPFYTILTAWMLDIGASPSVALARLPNVFFGAMLAAGAALWTRKIAGRETGWIVALFLLLWPSGIQVSQTVRFYAVHGALFFVAAVVVYESFRPGMAALQRLAMFALAGGALILAKQFQDSTLVGVLALSVWVATCVALPWAMAHRRRTAILGAGAALMLVGLAMLVVGGTLESVWSKFNFSPWGHDYTNYHRVLGRFYPVVWPLTPFLAILALRAFPRPASFCVVMVTVVLIVHSFAGVQNLRYIYYASPFLFALWAMGLRVALPVAARVLRQAADSLPRPVRHPRMGSALVAATGLFALLAQDAVPSAIKLALGRTAAPLVRVEDWSEARGPVAQAVEEGALVVATNELAAIYYLDGFDVVFSKNWIPQMNEIEFARDPRTGRPLISTTDSLASLVAAYPDGVFLASEFWWHQWPSGNSVAKLMQAFEQPGVTTRIERTGPLWILRWQGAASAPTDEGADAVRSIVDPGRRAR